VRVVGVSVNFCESASVGVGVGVGGYTCTARGLVCGVGRRGVGALSWSAGSESSATASVGVRVDEGVRECASARINRVHGRPT
jgi:hypothetical protein